MLLKGTSNLIVGYVWVIKEGFKISEVDYLYTFIYDKISIVKYHKIDFYHLLSIKFYYQRFTSVYTTFSFSLFYFYIGNYAFFSEKVKKKIRQLFKFKDF